MIYLSGNKIPGERAYQQSRYCFWALFLLWGFGGVAHAQYYDTLYVKELSNRVLVSYFQEYRSLNMDFVPDKKIDTAGRENLRLRSSSALYSGFAIHYKAISIVLAGTLPQTQEEISKNGKQSSSIWRISYAKEALFLSFNHVRYTGFYDENFNQHAFAPLTDNSAFARYDRLKTLWLSFEAKYYPNYKQFAAGIPYNFGLWQLKSKFAWGYRFAYNHINSNNNGKPFFSESLQSGDYTFGTFQTVYNGINFSAAPSFYLTGKSRLFLYGELWAGADAGFHKNRAIEKDNSVFHYALVVPQARLIAGYHTDKFLATLYYSFVNQRFTNQNLVNSLTFQTFGVMLGYRFYAPARLAL
jgi:hypothetical protein